MRDLIDAAGMVLLAVAFILAGYALYLVGYALFIGTLRVVVWITEVLLLGV